ncbi:hypothetical protein [Methanocaldococcus fervens]|nr:hypothetical protein [Methanocaldococcus fervens]
MKKLILLIILIILTMFSGCIDYQNDFMEEDISSILLELNETKDNYILKIYLIGENSNLVKREGILKISVYDDKNNQLYYKEIFIDLGSFEHLDYGDGVLVAINKDEINKSSSRMGRVSIDFVYNGNEVWIDKPITLPYEKENTNLKSSDAYHVTYSWEYKGRIHYLDLYIPKNLYDYYKSKKREYVEDYSYYVLDPYDDWYLNRIIQKIDEICKENGYDERDRINLVISFVQQLPYTYDNISTGYDEYPRYPIETLVDGGDCEDTSILTAALLNQMGYDVALMRFSQHMGVGINLDNNYGYYYEYNGKRYFYLETTETGWEIGDLPDELKDEGAMIFPITEKPIYIWSWEGYLYSNGYAEVTVNIKNAGNLEGRIKVYCAFDAGEGYVYNPTESPILVIEPGEEKVVKLKLKVPDDENTRLIVGLLDPETNKLIDVKYSTELTT